MVSQNLNINAHTFNINVNMYVTLFMHCFMTVSTRMPLGAQTFGNKVYCIV